MLDVLKVRAEPHPMQPGLLPRIPCQSCPCVLCPPCDEFASPAGCAVSPPPRHLAMAPRYLSLVTTTWPVEQMFMLSEGSHAAPEDVLAAVAAGNNGRQPQRACKCVFNAIHLAPSSRPKAATTSPSDSSVELTAPLGPLFQQPNEYLAHGLAARQLQEQRIVNSAPVVPGAQRDRAESDDARPAPTHGSTDDTAPRA